MSDIKEIFKAYKASDYRDPEFDAMMNEVKRELGVSEADVIGILEEMAKDPAFRPPAGYTPETRTARNISFGLFKKAEAAYDDAVAKYLNEIEEAVTKGDVAEVSKLTKKLGNLAKSPDVGFQKAIHKALKMIQVQAPNEVIDDMPFMKAIKAADPSVFKEMQKIKVRGETHGFEDAERYIHRPGSEAEVERLIQELRKPNPDKQALDRFKEIANAEVGLWGKDSEAAKMLASAYDEREVARALEKLDLDPKEGQRLLNNFRANKIRRLPIHEERMAGLIGKVIGIFSKKSGLTAAERLGDAAGIAAKPAGTLMKMMKWLWNFSGIGKPLSIALGLGAGLAGAAKVSDFFSGDKDSAPASGEAASGEAAAGKSSSSATLTSDPALTGNLHQNMRTILKRTFGPR
jgi:hypothetical protein